jgi:hypothetical protein
MISNRADSVRLADGDIAHSVKGGAPQPLTRQPLGDGQLLTLLREMAPPEFASRLDGREPVEFTYTNSAGQFITRVTQDSGKLGAIVSALPVAAATPAQQPVAAPPAHAPIAESAPAAPARVVEARAGRTIDSAARIEIESLLRLLVQEDGSDLHLRVGEAANSSRAWRARAAGTEAAHDGADDGCDGLIDHAGKELQRVLLIERH